MFLGFRKSISNGNMSRLMDFYTFGLIESMFQTSKKYFEGGVPKYIKIGLI